MNHARQALFPLLLAATGPAIAAVSDIYPADYVSLAEGTTILTAYAYQRDSGGPYRSGAPLLDGHLESTVTALRWSHFYRLGDYLVSPHAVISWSDTRVEPTVLRTALGPGATGLGDFRLGGTIWLKNDRARGEYLGLSAAVLAPTARWDSRQVLNPGENRWRQVLNAGWIVPLGKSWIVELLPELAWYGDNDAYPGGRHLRQKPTLALTSYLRYRLASGWQIHLGGQINRGGSSLINDVDQHNAPNNDRLMLGVTWLGTPGQQWIARVARDVASDNGFRLDSELALRALFYF